MLMDSYRYAAVGGGTDPSFASVVALLHFDGSNGSTTFTDQKGKTWTRTGSGTIDTSQSVFGGASFNDSTVGGYLSTSSHADFGYGTGDFTIELAIRPATVAGAVKVIYDQRVAIGGTRPTIFLSGATLTYYANGANRIIGANLSANTWYRIAVSRVSGTTRLYINGTQSGSNFTDSINYDTSLVILGQAGNSLGGSEGFSGHIDELRITKGVGRYASNYTPAAAAFPDS